MPSLYWNIYWRWGVYPFDRATQQACEKVIREHLLQSSRAFMAADVGCKLEELAVQIQNTSVEFSAFLDLVDPPEGFKVDLRTNIYAQSPQGANGASSSIASASSPDNELESFILRKITFDTAKPDPHYIDIYNSLIGIEKEKILEEAMSLLAPLHTIQEWGKRHYNQIPPVLRMAINKAPVIIFGGDPGTGKTALATSIGAQLSKLLLERVHFRHMSLSMRGMGYHGRSGTLIVKSFDQINQEYAQLHEPMIVFFDEAEAVVGSREYTDVNAGTQQDIANVDAIIVGIDSLRKGVHSRVVVIFATNIIERVDAALMRRGYYHHFERPNEQARWLLLKSSLQGLNFNDTDFNTLAQATKPRIVNDKEVPFTHSDIVESIVVRAVNTAVRLNKPLTLELLLDYCQRATPTKPLHMNFTN